MYKYRSSNSKIILGSDINILHLKGSKFFIKLKLIAAFFILIAIFLKKISKILLKKRT